jgi:hypothetical protein
MVFEVDDPSSCNGSSVASSACSKGDDWNSNRLPDEEILSSVESSYLDEDDDDEDTTAEPTSESKPSTDDNPLDEMKKYAAMENRLVNRWRRIVIISILVAGAIVGSITYVTLNDSQNDDSTNAVRYCYFC